jgi:hypothetical protein
MNKLDTSISDEVIMKKLILILLLLIFLVGCSYRVIPGRVTEGKDGYSPMQPGMGPGGMTWGPGSFDSLGEQIYFTGIDENGERISYRGGPDTGMMMQGYLSCASCHGPDARGGEHVMHMQVMDAPDIRWQALSIENEGEHEDGNHHETYDLKAFRLALVEGKHPEGAPLSPEMPRWKMSEESLRSLMEYLKSLP